MALHIGRVRVKLHPLMLMLPLMAARLHAGGEAMALFAALCCHECAHLLAARWLGVGISSLQLMPFGGAIALDNPYVLTRGQLLGVAAGGPAGSLLALICAAALPWSLPV